MLEPESDEVSGVQLRQQLRGVRGPRVPVLRGLHGARADLHRREEAGPAHQGEEDGAIITVIDIVIIRSVLSASPSRMETIKFTRSSRPGRIVAGGRILRTRGWC